MANGIPMISKGTDMYLRIKLPDMIYLMFLSDVIIAGDKFISLVSLREVTSSFSVQFSPAEVKKAIETLKSQRIIDFTDDKEVILGDISEDHIYLYVNKETKSSLNSEFEKVKPLLDRLESVSRDKAVFSYAHGIFCTLQVKRVTEYAYTDIYNLYKMLYIVTVQERSRDLSQKEYGLLQTLCKQFSIVTAAKLIFQYFLYSARYKKSGAISVMSLYFVKDRLNEDIRTSVVDDKKYSHDDETV